MRLEAPGLDIDEEATPALIADAIPRLAGVRDPFLILARSDLEYMQTLCDEGGYFLEFQEGSTDRHFRAVELLGEEEVVEALTLYLARDERWRAKHEFEHFDTRSLAERVGYGIGQAAGSFVRGFRRGAEPGPALTHAGAGVSRAWRRYAVLCFLVFAAWSAMRSF